jgi:hypothetical protein
VMPEIDARLRTAVIAIVRAAGYHPLTSGVYVNAMGPRFETKAEIRTMAAAGDVVRPACRCMHMFCLPPALTWPCAVPMCRWV